MALYLVPQRDGRPIVIDKAVLFVGRHPDCDVILTKSRKVSRKHCCLAQVDNQFFIRDLGSMNGVEVNGERVSGSAPVGVGDEIMIGDVVFELKADERTRQRSAPGRGAAPPPPASTASRPKPPATTPPIAEPIAADPADISQDMPVPIPDEGVSFQVEHTQAQPVVPPQSRATIDDSQNPIEDDVIPIDSKPIAYDDDDGSLPDV